LADCDLTTARKEKTMMKHRTGDSEVERDLGENTTAPQALTERTMTDFMRDEPSAPAVVDRGTFQAELDALRVREKATREKATPLQLPADGSPWSRWMVPHRSLANVGR
jgi:hypothetical protein